MKSLLLLITLFLNIVFSFGQEQREFVLFGKVFDGSGKEKVPIPDVKVKIGEQVIGTNRNGEFQIKIHYELELSVEFSHVGFKSYSQRLTDKIVKKKIVGDTLYWNNIFLLEKTLVGMTVLSHKVDTVFGSTRYSVEDYSFLPEEKLLLLAYEKTLDKQAQLLLTDSKQALIDTYTIPSRALHLYRDYAANNYVVCEDKIYRINIRGEQIHLLSISDEDFYGFHHRVIDTIGNKYYYSNYNELYPAVKFYVTERNDTTHTELYEVKDDFMMELYRAQYKYVSGRDKLWAYRKEQQTGIDKEIWVGASVFTNDILYKPIYAPLFVKNDSIYLFDHYQNYIFNYNSAIELLDSIPITYHLKSKNEKWSQPLIQDEKEKDIFVLFNSGGFYIIKKIDNGKVNKGFKLTNRYVENIKIYDGYVYYVYRPYESIQKKFIYKEKIPR